jgi:leader peptidase (prepilin peptidase)/N-methyltransferase
VNIVYAVFAFLFGAAIGSFLNVVVYRLPVGISIIKPRSFCPSCKKPIMWYENIPIVSYVVLGGKCSRCKKPISIHYPLVELITAVLFLYLFLTYGVSLTSLFYAYFFCTLIIISGIDFSHQFIPDMLSIPGIIVGIVFQILNSNFWPGLIGMVFGGGLILMFRVFGGWAYKKEVMGMGDVYLTAMIGAFAGFPFIIVSIFFAALIGSVLGLVYIASTHQSRETPIRTSQTFLP